MEWFLIKRVCWPLTRGEVLELERCPTAQLSNLATWQHHKLICFPHSHFWQQFFVLSSLQFSSSLTLFSNFNSLSSFLLALPTLSPNFSFHGSSLLSSFEPKLLLFSTTQYSLCNPALFFLFTTQTLFSQEAQLIPAL